MTRCLDGFRGWSLAELVPHSGTSSANIHSLHRWCRMDILCTSSATTSRLDVRVLLHLSMPLTELSLVPWVFSLS